MGIFSAKLLFLLISASMFLDFVYGSSQELSFTMNVAGQRPNPSAIYQGNNVLLTCSTIAGYSIALKITRSGINETVQVDMTTESTVTLNMRNISCDKMDRYVCEGPGGETVFLDVGIYNCGPLLCPGEKNFTTIFTGLHDTKKVSFCVTAYPHISHTAKLNYKSIRTSESLNNRWLWVSENRSFSTYTIKVTISNISKEDYGNHTLTFSTSQLGTKNLEYTIYLRPPDIPDCPTDISVNGTGMDYITLSWKPGLDGGSDQTFDVFYSSNASVSVMVPSIDSTSSNITGLKPGTAYNFTVQVIPNNKNGSNSDCGGLQVEARTKTKTAWIATTTSHLTTTLAAIEANSSVPDVNSTNCSLYLPLFIFLGSAPLLFVAVYIAVSQYFKRGRRRSRMRCSTVIHNSTTREARGNNQRTVERSNMSQEHQYTSLLY